MPYPVLLPGQVHQSQTKNEIHHARVPIDLALERHLDLGCTRSKELQRLEEEL